MAELFNIPSDIVFSSGLNDIVIPTDKDFLNLSLKDPEDETIYDEQLNAHEGKVTVTDISEIIELDMRRKNKVFSVYKFYVRDRDSSGLQKEYYELKVIYCEAASLLKESAASFIDNNFLTTLDTRRVPSDARFSLFICSENIQSYGYDMQVYYRLKDSDEIESYVSSPPIHGSGLFEIEIDIPVIRKSRANVLGIDERQIEIVSFSIRHENRYAAFFVDKSLDTGKAFYFKNIFNVIDSAFFPALVKSKTEVSRSLASVGNVSMFYDRSVSKTFEIESGPVDIREAGLIAQLVASPAAFVVMDDNSPDLSLKEILITDSDASFDDSDDTKSVKFTWRFTDNRPAFLFSDSKRIFTSQFNKVFS